MCRLAAFPPNFPRADAIEILKEFENNNTDGTGAAWVEDGKFVIDKYPKSLTKVVRRHRFLRHMPHNGWTIAHLRAASVGDNKFHNTHPFIAGPWAVCHNGTFTEHKIVKLALGNRIKFDGETDSEAAAHLISVTGPKKFSENVDYSGVFLALNQNGDLWAIKTSGDLKIQSITNDRVLLASTFDICKFDPVEAHIGWYHFDPQGRYIKHRKQRDSWSPVRRPIPPRHDACGPSAPCVMSPQHHGIDDEVRHQYYYMGCGD
jgi:predicted glutamine amidotransferase